MTDRNAQVKTVPLAFVQALMLPLRARHIDTARILRECDIDADLTAVGIAEYNRLVLAVLELLQDESGGTMAGLNTPYGTTRMLIYAILNCRTLREAMTRAIEFNRVCLNGGNDATARVDLIEDGTERTAWLVYRSKPGGRIETDPAVVCNLVIWLRLCGWLIGRQIEVIAAECAGAEPGDAGMLDYFLNCPVAWSRPANAVAFSTTYLSMPLVRDEIELDHFLRNAPYQVIVSAEVGEESIVSRIRHLLDDEPDRPLPGFDAMADALGMSSRTLRRRLDEEGTSYQTIKDNLRREHATRLLEKTSLPIAEIADRLGFSDASAFHRSFRKWTGLAPGDYRRRRLAL